ncbi:MAG: SET domain-containing protein-lysine N-methyltransferase [Flavisolibacter sp.]
MKICVLQPDYSTTAVDYQYYDPPRDLSSLWPDAQVDHVFVNKLTAYRQLKELSRNNYDIFVNLCEGYLEWEVAGVDVYFSLELLDLPYTGPGTKLYDVPKELMKYVAYCEGVRIPAYAVIDSLDKLDAAIEKLNFPLFIKPAKAGDSLGVDEHSLAYHPEELRTKAAEIIDEYGPLMVEEYISGREFTVLVAANAENEKTCTVFRPVEYVFPKGMEFKTYALKTSELHPDCNFPCTDQVLDKELRAAAERIFCGFGGVGYARMDFRVNEKNEVFFLEVNFTCSVFYKDGYEGSADFILKFDGIGQDGFLRHIVAEGIARHERKRKPFVIRGNAISGFGIYANRDMRPGEYIFSGEEKAQRLVTLRHVEKNWSENEKEIFRRYAYPISKEVFLIWDNDPTRWAPQNHSCQPNTAYNGLNVVTTRPVANGEELTLDYATFLDQNMQPFHCLCGAPNCRGLIIGLPSNSITERELKVKKKMMKAPRRKRN